MHWLLVCAISIYSIISYSTLNDRIIQIKQYTMCFPVGLLKSFTGIGAAIIALFGSVVLGAGIYGMIHEDINFTDFNSVKNSILLPIVIFATVVTLGAALGAYGIRKGKPFCILIFSILVMLFLLAFFIIAIVSKFLPQLALQQNCATTSSNWAGSMRNISILADTQFCSPSCQCGMNVQQQNLYDANQTAQLNTYYTGINSSSPNLQFQACYQNQLYSDVLAPLGEMEKFFSCTGWCSEDSQNGGADLLFYKFSNVNNGLPTAYCYDKVRDYLTQYGDIIFYVSGGFTIFLALVCLCNTCLCCHPDRKGRKLYRRFHDDDQDNYYRR